MGKLCWSPLLLLTLAIVLGREWLMASRGGDASCMLSQISLHRFNEDA